MPSGGQGWRPVSTVKALGVLLLVSMALNVFMLFDLAKVLGELRDMRTYIDGGCVGRYQRR